MITTRKAFTIAALIVATGVIGVEMTRSPAQAEDVNVAARIDSAFQAAAQTPQVAEVRVPMAEKGDLQIPMGCVGVQTNLQAECVNTAYSLLTEPSYVVATSFGSTTTLMRVDAIAVADVIGNVFGADEQSAAQ